MAAPGPARRGGETLLCAVRSCDLIKRTPQDTTKEPRTALVSICYVMACVCDASLGPPAEPAAGSCPGVPSYRISCLLRDTHPHERGGIPLYSTCTRPLFPARPPGRRMRWPARGGAAQSGMWARAADQTELGCCRANPPPQAGLGAHAAARRYAAYWPVPRTRFTLVPCGGTVKTPILPGGCCRVVSRGLEYTGRSGTGSRPGRGRTEGGRCSMVSLACTFPDRGRMVSLVEGLVPHSRVGVTVAAR